MFRHVVEYLDAVVETELPCVAIGIEIGKVAYDDIHPDVSYVLQCLDILGDIRAKNGLSIDQQGRAVGCVGNVQFHRYSPSFDCMMLRRDRRFMRLLTAL